MDELGSHNANVILDQMMARIQLDGDERTAIATKNATKLASANQANATMESKMKTLLAQVQALQLANTPNHVRNYGRGRRRGTGRGRGRALPSSQPTPKYCCTQGNCRHVSKKCT